MPSIAQQDRRPIGTGVFITRHSAARMAERGVEVARIARLFSDPDRIRRQSVKDPKSNRYVLRDRELRIVWTDEGGQIVVLSVFVD